MGIAGVGIVEDSFELYPFGYWLFTGQRRSVGQWQDLNLMIKIFTGRLTDNTGEQLLPSAR